MSATDAEPGTAPAAVPAERVAAVEAAAHRWASQLVDLTGRNNLLYFRDLKVGTMDFATAPEDALFDVLAGRPVRLKRLVPDPDDRPLAARRARTVHNRAQEHFEERGLETLFVACGMASWTSQRGSATPAAPVLLCPARLVPIGAAQDEFELSITGDAEVNQTLLHMLERERGRSAYVGTQGGAPLARRGEAVPACHPGAARRARVHASADRRKWRPARRVLAASCPSSASSLDGLTVASGLLATRDYYEA